MVKNRILASLMILALTAGVMLSGCGKATETSKSPADTTTAQATESTTAATVTETQKVKLVYMTTHKPDKLKAILDRYKEKRPDVEIETIELVQGTTAASSDQVIAKFDATIATGTVVDVFDGGAGGTGIIRPRAMNGTLLPMDEYIKSEGMNMDELFPKGSAYTCTFGEPAQWYTLPLTKQVYPVFYNKDMFKAANLAEPTAEWTLDDLRQYAAKLTTGEGVNKVFGAWIPVDWGWFVGVPCQVAGWEAYVEKDGKKVPNFDSPYLKKTMQIYYDMSMVDLSNPTAAEITLNKLNMNEYFAEGKTAMIVGNAWALGDLQKARAMGKLNFEMGVAPLPRVDETVPMDVSASEIGLGYAIPQTSANPAEAFKFIKFVTLECADILRELPASNKVDEKTVMGFLGTYIDENGKKYENLFKKEEMEGFFENRTGMKIYYKMKEDAFVGPLWGVLHDETGKVMTDAEKIDDAIRNMMERGVQEIDKVAAGK